MTLNQLPPGAAVTNVVGADGAKLPPNRTPKKLRLRCNLGV